MNIGKLLIILGILVAVGVASYFLFYVPYLKNKIIDKIVTNVDWTKADVSKATMIAWLKKQSLSKLREAEQIGLQNMSM